MLSRSQPVHGWGGESSPCRGSRGGSGSRRAPSPYGGGGARAGRDLPFTPACGRWPTGAAVLPAAALPPPVSSAGAATAPLVRARAAAGFLLPGPCPVGGRPRPLPAHRVLAAPPAVTTQLCGTGQSCPHQHSPAALPSEVGGGRKELLPSSRSAARKALGPPVMASLLTEAVSEMPAWACLPPGQGTQCAEDTAWAAGGGLTGWAVCRGPGGSPCCGRVLWSSVLSMCVRTAESSAPGQRQHSARPWLPAEGLAPC